MRSDIICILDIGSWNIKGLAVKVTKDGSIQQICFGNTRSEGIEKGRVIDLDSLSDSIEQTVSKMEQQLNKRICKVFICIGGDHIKSYSSKGSITLSEVGSEIKSSDVRKAIESAKLLSMPMDRRILHIYNQGYTVDGQSGINTPIGMFGTKLETSLYIITALEKNVQNIIKAINNIGIQVEGVKFSGFMNVYGVFTEEKRQRGGVVFDIGAGSTNFVSVKENQFLDVKVFPFGSFDVINQIKKELKIPFKEAEKKKRDIISFYPPAEVNQSDSLNDKDKKVVEIIYNTINENLTKIKRDIDGYVFDLVSENFVVAGGLTFLGGIVELIEDIFNIRAKIANPKIINLGASNDSFLNLSSCVAPIGTLNVLLKERIVKYGRPIGKVYMTLNRVRDFFSEYF